MNHCCCIYTLVLIGSGCVCNNGPTCVGRGTRCRRHLRLRRGRFCFFGQDPAVTRLFSRRTLVPASPFPTEQCDDGNKQSGRGPADCGRSWCKNGSRKAARGSEIVREHQVTACARVRQRCRRQWRHGGEAWEARQTVDVNLNSYHKGDYPRGWDDR